MDYLNLLQQLNVLHGPSGDEGEVTQLLKELASPYGDCQIDTLGNLIVHRAGKGPKLLFAAHMDSIGLIVTHIEKDGYLRFGKIGGLHFGSLLHTPVRFKNGVYGVVALREKAEEKERNLQDLYLDIGAKSEEEARRLVQVGDSAVCCMHPISMGSRLCAPYMDNRISCLILLEAMQLIKESENDLYFVFTVQEELGLRGAKTAAFAIDPDYGLSVDVTLADALDSKHQGSSKLGGGAAIKVMDSSVIAHPQMVETLEDLAKEHQISWQRDIITAGGTDAGPIHLNGAGVITGGISVPCRYIHSPVEMVDLGDVEACAKLVAAFAQADLSK